MKQYILRIENMIPYFQKQIKLQHNHIRKTWILSLKIKDLLNFDYQIL